MTTPASPAPSVHELEAQRRANREAVAKLGLTPYGVAVKELSSMEVARQKFDAEADARYNEAQTKAREAAKAGGGGAPASVRDDRPVVTVAGRVMLRRPGGKLIWMNLRDDTGDLQIAVSAKDCDEAGFKLAELTDLGDVLVATGPLMKTKTGEVTVWCSSLRPASKCLVPPPEKHAGLVDIELRYRQRYVDLWANPETIATFKMRSNLISRIRRHLDQRGFLEVETPMLQTLAGGAAARPFVTHMNALDINLFMRIAPELYLKRLLVGGLPRVYEINRNFRNEGLDKRHNPEFTMMEIYWAYADARSMMDLVEGLIRELASTVAMARQDAGAPAAEGALPSELKLPFGDWLIDYGSPFVRVSYGELFKQALGFPMDFTPRVHEEARKRGVKVTNEKGEALADVLIVNELFENFAEPTLDHTRPTFITDYPSAISPLTRPRPDNPALADRADLFIGGMEVAPIYTELNDPDIQEAKFREQLAGGNDEESTFRTYDADFVNALKVGMPPAGGLGLGIDRLVMLLCNQATIRDVVLFPLMRPQA
jgi:lysyl-tRNA synthetase class 2